MAQQEFGGDWTQDKLTHLRKYLSAYMKIFNPRPWLNPIYVDAFAGTGSIHPKVTSVQSNEQDEDDVKNFLNGSVRVALETEPPFSHYLFIEKNASKVKELEKLRDEYAHLAERIQIEKADANQFLMQWCSETNWVSNRAVVFLDPFGMQVDWQLLETIAKTGPPPKERTSS
jgi:three-Cys-motif partner protein